MMIIHGGCGDWGLHNGDRVYETEGLLQAQCRPGWATHFSNGGYEKSMLHPG